MYGSAVGDDDLFFQHTYLTIVAKTMATRVVGAEMPAAADLLSGRPFQDAGIDGAVESDFFDWVLAGDGSADLIGRIARQVARFRLADVQTDVLKGLYESLIDPRQRHDLGEYYTPDWLAARICERVIDRPLEQRVLDPACGSGTFLFHAVRRFLAAADAEGLANRDALSRCCGQVLGIDVHPVAVLIARVTYLLGLGERLRDPDRPRMSIPVYLGDSLQWNTRGFLAEREVLIEVPEGGPVLEFPFAVARDPALFDAVIKRMLALSEEEAPREALEAWLRREHGLDDHTVGVLTQTYSDLRDLRSKGQNHIWGFVARNLVRPVWLSQHSERADVIVGNPPWLAYGFMSDAIRKRFRAECQERGLWVGGRFAARQDLSAYFFARCVELYFKPNGVIAFVMPYGVMSRRQYERFLRGIFGRPRGRRHVGSVTFARFTEAWAFSDDVQNLFQVPSCVLFARLHAVGDSGKVLPASVERAVGILPKRDATPTEAEAALTWRQEPWPALPAREGATWSPYHKLFREGATVRPRVLFVVQRVPAGPLGGNPAAPLVQSRRTRQEKAPWKNLAALRKPVESDFLRRLYLGESVAPFRVLAPLLAVIPWEEETKRLLDGDAAQRAGYPLLSRWLREAEGHWLEHRRRPVTLVEQLDHFGKLSGQLPGHALRVVYTTHGTLPAAGVIRDAAGVIEDTLYWFEPADVDEARYLSAILNSAGTRRRIEHLQSRGQWGARHVVKLLLELPIPRFASGNSLHRALAEAAQRAEEVAAGVPLREGEHFVRARGLIRKALAEDGISGRIDKLVERLLAK